jgi:tetratricopeptide (TPR) repeat protein
LILDPGLTEAHQAQGFVELYFEWNWDVAGVAFEKAIELDPDDATTLQWFTMWYLAMDRDEEALALGRQAEALDPLSPVVAAHVTWLVHMLGDFEQAIGRARAAIRRDRHFWRGYLSLAMSLAAAGQVREAANAAQIAAALNDQTATTGVWAHALAQGGDLALARTILAQAATGARYFSPYFMAYALTGLGDYDAAFASLERSVCDREWFLLFLKHEPAFQPLRSDPRFDAIRLKIGLP